MKIRTLHIISIAAEGSGLSGGDRLFTQIALHLDLSIWCVQVITSSAGMRMCDDAHLPKRVSITVPRVVAWLESTPFMLRYIGKILSSGITAYTCYLRLRDAPHPYIYVASDFWADLFPACMVKIVLPGTHLCATWYQTAPNPWKGFVTGASKRRHNDRSRSLHYWLVQAVSNRLIRIFADTVVVNNADEQSVFPGLRKEKLYVMYGGVPVDEIRTYLQKRPHSTKDIDCVFQGRLHPQKGVLELIDIWSRLITRMHDARLVIIGDGPLMNRCRQKVKELGLENHITFVGYVFDGDVKYDIFSRSKIVLHPSLYDSGGMAAAEAMAFGIPCIGFDLPAYKSYYPHGMIKVPAGELDAYAQSIQDLLVDQAARERLGQEAMSDIHARWSWQKRVHDFQRHLISCTM